MSAALVVPAGQADRWIDRLAVYAAERRITVGAVVVVADQATARRDLLTLLVSGEVDSILVAFAADLPSGFLVEASAPVSARPMHQRPRPIDRGIPR